MSQAQQHSPSRRRGAAGVVSAFALAGLATLVGMAGGAAEEPRCRARAFLQDAAGTPLGTVTLAEESTGTLLTASLRDLQAGVYAFHIHERGVCVPPFDSAGGHFNPAGKEHGFFNHAGHHVGDLPNVVAVGDSQIGLQLFLPDLDLCEGEARLLDDDGAAFVLHAKADDYRTDPAGDAGSRLACGVIAALEN